MRPMTVERWAEYRHLTDLMPEEMRGKRIHDEAEVIRRNAQWLIEHLYDPNEEVGSRQSTRTKELGMYDEAINWGDLFATVERLGSDTFIVTVEEASPDAYGLRDYIQDWLTRWGWNVRVETEW